MPVDFEICESLLGRKNLICFELDPSFPEPGPKLNSDLREAVVYCYLLHRIVTKYVEEPEGPTTFTEKLFDHCEDILRGEGHTA